MSGEIRFTKVKYDGSKVSLHYEREPTDGTQDEFTMQSADKLELARQFGEKTARPLWSTEVSCFDSRTGVWGQQYDPTIASGLILASLVWQGLTVANDAAFHWWVACSPVCWTCQMLP